MVAWLKQNEIKSKIESGEFNRGEWWFRLGVAFAKVAEEMLEQNILQKFNTNAKHSISVEHFQYPYVLVVFCIIQ